ncbi:hypothetical protein [Gandjariella thermophila]|uniref:Uncharacterized protein n=1 Tax=Gandjariella thermophila TaxID=1931992 RepID=A0A4D4J534_9PSEU|nr:hypothetical protein [Gandjariella thermophila]GDY31785.1 hypothetical protein GTS_34180 [Gandjariella thermophila]
MNLYAERPFRVAGQAVADALVVAWLAVSCWAAIQVRDWVLGLRDPGLRLTQAGADLQHTFTSTAQHAGKVPLVGGPLSDALGHGADAGQVMIDAGQRQIAVVDDSAVALAAAVVVFGVVPVLWWWLPRRLRYARAAGAAKLMRERDPELLALRALTALPARRLLAISAEPAAAWHRGETAVTEKLAAAHLAALGLRLPPKARATVPTADAPRQAKDSV